jgi:cell division protein FtsB
MDPTFLGRAAVTFAVLLGSLGFVTWRQSRSLETLAEWDEVRREVSVARAQVVELDREIQVLTSRARVVPEARVKLGMHMPDGSELEILDLGAMGEAP